MISLPCLRGSTRGKSSRPTSRFGSPPAAPISSQLLSQRRIYCSIATLVFGQRLIAPMTSIMRGSASNSCSMLGIAANLGPGNALAKSFSSRGHGERGLLSGLVDQPAPVIPPYVHADSRSIGCQTHDLQIRSALGCRSESSLTPARHASRIREMTVAAELGSHLSAVSHDLGALRSVTGRSVG